MLTLLSVVCFALTGCGIKQLTATEIYNECIYNVVEVKAVSENVGESFGTAELISGDGKFITNAHVVTYTRLNVVNHFESYYIRFSFEDDYREVTLEKFDSEKDLALLKLKDVSDLSLKPVKVGNSDNLQAGELVGITTFRTKDNSGNVIYGIVYCIPVNTVVAFLNG